MQPTSLKALANKVLERNRQSNQHASDLENRCNLAPQKQPQKFHNSCTENMPPPPTVKGAKSPSGSKDSTRGSLFSEKEAPAPPVKKRRRQKARLVTKSMVEAWRVGRKWMLAHLPDLEQAGWTRRKLLRAGRFTYPCGEWGAAFSGPWMKAGARVEVEPGGAITWTWTNATGREIRQRARPKHT